MRRAGPDDAAAMVELRAAMFAAMGTDPGPAAAPWRSASLGWFAERLASRDRFAAFVVDVEGWPVSGAAVECEPHSPNPWNPSGLRAELFNVCTLPGYGGRGFGRACVAAVLDWVRAETTAGTVRLSATAAGIGIYRSLGFTEARYPAMRLSVER